MAKSPFTVAHLRDTGEALYGTQWQAALARDLKVPVRSIGRWFDGSGRLPDLRHELADICRRYAGEDRRLAKLAPTLERLGPPER
jgi:hypothetical protein